MINSRQIIIFSVATILVGISTFGLIPYWITNQSWGWHYNTDTGVIGDTIGGTVGPIVGFIGMILTFLAFYIQYQANKIQLKLIQDQKADSVKNDRVDSVRQIEGTFFELLKIHRENIHEMSFRDESGRKVLGTILHQFYRVLDFIDEQEKKWTGLLEGRDKANIAYLITFYGVKDSAHSPLHNLISRYYPEMEGQIIELIKYINSQIGPLAAKRITYNLVGHQSRLGHYYRHLFMAINFIHEDVVLTFEEKKKYIKFIRAQMSVQEQVLFFFNSLSILGESWELGSSIVNANKLITKYSLIRNIPPDSIHGFSPRTFYPNVRFELDFEPYSILHD